MQSQRTARIALMSHRARASAHQRAHVKLRASAEPKIATNDHPGDSQHPFRDATQPQGSSPQLQQKLKVAQLAVTAVEPDDDEDLQMLRAMRDSNLPKFLRDDIIHRFWQIGRAYQTVALPDLHHRADRLYLSDRSKLAVGRRLVV